jgi:tetratricopeptide (TPR) repeat protein
MSLYRSRPQQIAAIVVFVALGGIGFAPLFGGPGYEHALACGLILPSAAAIATAIEVARARELMSPLDAIGRGILSGLWLAILGFATAILHGLRVGFCDLPGGAQGFAMTAGAGAVMGGAWGAVVSELARRRKRKRLWATLLALAAPIGGIAISLWRFYSSPMIFAFDPFFGHFSGTLYDTVIDAGGALVSYRVGSLATLIGIVLVASVLTRDARGALRFVALRGHPGPLARLILGAGALAVSAFITLDGAALGHWETSSTIARDLGGRRAGPRCDVVYPDGQRAETVALLVRDCEEQLRSVEALLGARGPERVTAFFFRDAADKKRLMGAADTYIAKPWRHEVYLQVQSYPHPVLGHELAHVVAGSFGSGAFQIAGTMKGLWPNPGLIEGVAVAAAPDDDELTDAQWARAMMELDILPPMHRIFSLGFLGESSAKSYTIAGAFVRWVLERDGAEIVRRWYSGEDLAQILGRSWDALDGEFRVALARQELLPETLAYAKAKFDRPSVFGRRCPHVVDALRHQADHCRDSLQVDKAIALYGKVLTRDPHDNAARFGRALTRERYGDADLGRRDLARMGEDESVPRTWRDRSEETIADDEMLRGDADHARARYEALAAKQLDEDIGRTLEVKAYASRMKAGREAIAALLIGEPGRPVDTTEAAARLGAWAEVTHDPVAEYVLGKNLAQREYWGEAAEHLERAMNGGPEPTPRIARELLRQRAICACAQRDASALARVRAALDADSNPFRGSSGGRREWLERMLARCAGP